ncbi:MAG: hypothetical protein AB1454_00030 [Candidatus Auribacterota bacterium]
MSKKYPEKGFIFWPVGNGDSTTILVNKKKIIQLDINHTSASDKDDDPRFPVVDELIKILPKIDGTPYLSTFALSHPDEDHCKGFNYLMEKAIIGELWFTPRIFREYDKDLCEDALAFKEEAERRIKKNIKSPHNIVSGDRIRLIGYDDLLKEEEYKGFSSSLLTVPGNEITEIDGEDCADSFRAFVHAPFKDDSSGERNDTSLGFQIRLLNDGVEANAVLLGDLCYPTVSRIFTQSEDSDLNWNILLAPHHCSKSVMYWKEEGEKEEKLKLDLLDKIEEVALSPGYIIASSNPIPGSNKEGDNPPHAKAKNRYQEIVPDQFICTMEHPNKETPVPIIFSVDNDGLIYNEEEKEVEEEKSMKSVVSEARGYNEPSKQPVGFGING